jgi:hypothetical protein
MVLFSACVANSPVCAAAIGFVVTAAAAVNDGYTFGAGPITADVSIAATAAASSAAAITGG